MSTNEPMITLEDFKHWKLNTTQHYKLKENLPGLNEYAFYKQRLHGYVDMKELAKLMVDLANDEENTNEEA